MRRFLLGLTICVLLAGGLAAQETDRREAEPAPAARFRAVDVFVDSGASALAAYQLELAAEVGAVKIVGVEGGEHSAFREPPYYDPAAISRDHVILAAFSTQKDLPKGRTRVARIHVQITGDVEPEYALKLTTAALPDGTRISAKVSLAEQGEAK